jgi:tetratricopeptide (TPR) repeat protein
VAKFLLFIRDFSCISWLNLSLLQHSNYLYMKRPYLLIITATLCLVLSSCMSLAKDSSKPASLSGGDTQSAEDKETIEVCKQVVSKNPNVAQSHFNLGIAYLKSGMYKEAIESLKQATKINPDDAKPHKTLGYVYMNLYMYEEAIGALKVVIKRDPDYAMSYYNLGFVYNVSNDKDSALEQYEILKSLDPELADKMFKLINK